MRVYTIHKVEGDQFRIIGSDSPNPLDFDETFGTRTLAQAKLMLLTGEPDHVIDDLLAHASPETTVTVSKRKDDKWEGLVFSNEKLNALKPIFDLVNMLRSA